MLVPQALHPGDRVRVVAPSGPFDRALVLRGLGWLSARYDVAFDEGIFARSGFLAGGDDRRLAELHAALREPGVRAVIATRGGYGLTRIAHAVDPFALRRDPRWIVGFSDITALHVEAARAGIASLHADNVASLGRGDADAQARFVEALEKPGTPRRIEGLIPFRGGAAAGPLAGGNLTVLFTCAAAGRLHLPEGCLLVLEDVGEAPYRVDRMLSALLSSGQLDRVAGVLVGDFTDAPPGRYGVPMEEVLRERLGELKVPVAAGLPVGHGSANHPLHLGTKATMLNSGVLCLGEHP